MAEPASTAPPGAYVELDLDLINEGRFKSMFQQKLRQALEGLLTYEKESGDLTASAQLVVKMKLQRPKGSKEFIDLLYHAKTQVPVIESVTTVKQAGNKLLCQPSGSNDGSPDQQLFYDAKGKLIGGLDKKTGEELNETEAAAVAGKIGRAATA